MSQPVAWRILCTTNGATGYLYTEVLPFDPGPGVRVRREPESLFSGQVMLDSVPFDELEAAYVRRAQREGTP
jgi:hypothetical protein